MKKFLLYLALGGFAIGTFSIYYYQPERVVKRKVQRLIDIINIDPTDGFAAQGFKVQRFESMLSDTITISSSLPELNRTFSREELASRLGGYLTYLESAEVLVSELSVERTGPELARARLTLPTSLSFSRGRSKDYLLSGFLDFSKESGSWKLTEGFLDESSDIPKY